MTHLHAVELFAGGGGLALGLRRAGVKPVAAVELDEYAARTFKENHPGVTLFQEDVRKVRASNLLEASPNGEIDVLAACPPCQGFSSLTSKYKREDQRNGLISEVGRLALELRPLAIMVENVPGLARRGRALFDDLIRMLESAEYVVNWDILQVADFGVPQLRRRLVLLAGRGFRIDMPLPSHSNDRESPLPPWRTLRDAIRPGREPLTIDLAQATGGLAAHDWHVVRKLGRANLARLRHAVPGEGRRLLPNRLRPRCHKGKDAGFANTYGRMSWDRPSSTITAGCLSPSKGRFGHPDELRTISLREAAALQTFPPDYKFVGESIDRTCSIVGNALPCAFAEAIARRVLTTVERVRPWL